MEDERLESTGRFISTGSHRTVLSERDTTGRLTPAARLRL
jgi:hypothetical protein